MAVSLSTTQGKSLVWQRMGRWSHFPFFSVFILLYVIPSRGFRLRGGVLPLPLSAVQAVL
jgi:hypothetical protein